MTIAELINTSKKAAHQVPRDILIVGILVFASSASFGLGVLAGRDMGQGSGFSISQIPLEASALAAQNASGASSVPPASIPAGGEVVASKNGTKYFLPWCGGASQIKDENKIWFKSKEAAETAGYQPAANCKGL
ncbi:MAG: hypothetical protein Q7R54_01745 [bacterium]|nr:hypothetical protein [bacterium]